MKAPSVLAVAGLFVTLGSSLTIPSIDGIVTRDDLNGTDELTILDTNERAVNPVFTFDNFPKSGKCGSQSYNAGDIRE